jgi:hypothetical protein
MHADGGQAMRDRDDRFAHLSAPGNEYAPDDHHGRELVHWYEGETPGMIPGAAGWA